MGRSSEIAYTGHMRINDAGSILKAHGFDLGFWGGSLQGRSRSNIKMHEA